MLRFNFFLFIVAFSSSLLCQQPDKPVLSLTYMDHWDSGTNDWVRNQRINYTYDENLNQIEAIYYSQSDSEPGGWISQLRFVYSYDAEGNRTGVVYYYWDSQSNNWVNNSRFLYTYDGNGNQIDFQYYYWDTQDNSWLAASRETVTYGNDQIRTGGSFYSWDPKLRNWFNYKYYTTSYDVDTNLLDARYYHWDEVSSGWKTDGHVYFEYDEDGNRLRFESHYINPATTDWQPNLQVNETYDETGNQTEGSYYRFNSQSNDWTAHWRYAYTYDPNGNRTEEVNYHWDPNTISWVNDLRNLISFDGNGNPNEEVHYLWETGTNTWENLKKVEHIWSDTVTIIPPDTTISESCGSCLDETFTDQAGSLSDNSCDEEYENFADCRKLIQVPGAEYINLVFTEFNIEDGYDFVRVYDGPTTGHTLMAEFTGTSVPGPITSSQGSILVHFTSDHSTVRSGWSAEYTSGEDPICFNKILTDESGIVDDNSGDGDYMINADCQKLIMPEDVSNITLTFTEFVLENGNDYVRVYDGPTTGDELLGEFTGTTLPASLTSSGGSLLIHFSSNGNVNASGWAASYTSTPSLCGPCRTKTFTETAGSFSDNSCDEDYVNFADCRKLIQVPDADYIDLVFTEFNIEAGYDYVRVYDGPTTGDALLGEFTGTSLPGSIASSQGSMLIHFISDHSTEHSGWSADYSSGEDPICLYETFIDKSGYVNENSGDRNYINNADCQKLIMPEDVLNITLTFTEFVLEDGNDFVRVYDGSTTGDKLLGEFTGTTLPVSVTSSGGSMLIQFTSNGSVNASGWAAYYTSIPSPCGPCQNMTFTAPADSISDNSCEGEYDNFADCRKVIRVTDADYINLVFTEFNLQEGNDSVRVYDGTTIRDPLLGEFTGTSLPGSITSSQGSMLVHFTSDHSTVGSGWSAEYTSGKLGTICTNETFSDESGIVDDNSGDGDYMVNADCHKLIVPEDVLNITLTFTEFVLVDGNDYVRVYDGATTGDALLGEFTGTSLPGSITSSGGSMLIHFTSDGSVNASGWAASYTSIPSPCGPCLDQTFTNQTGSFSDNSCDEEYDNFADCRKLIRVPDAEYIDLVFTEFNIQGYYDFVRVYDGATTGDALLGEFTGTTLPGSITSSQGSMLVHFISDHSTVSSGWSAEYTSGRSGTICVSETYTDESGIVDDNSGNWDYMINADCQKLIMPEDVLNITLAFTEFFLEDGNDYVRVYDGPTTGDELLGEFTGTSLPESITSSGGSLLIHFTSNGTVNASGWTASYTSIPSFCGSCRNITFAAPAGSFSDNSCDEDYDNFADCRKLIQVPDADYIDLVFTEFNIEAGYDYVRVYDGPTTDDALLGEFTGSLLPESITSSQSSMLIHFTSDSSSIRSGWSAKYTSTAVTAIPDNTMQPGKESILVYPNPVTDHVTVEISNNLEISKIEIFDLYGRKLRILDNINSTAVTLQRDNLQTGIYILRIHAADTHIKKIFVW